MCILVTEVYEQCMCCAWYVSDGVPCHARSGTYNNQYMVVKMDLFTPGQALPNDLLWVCEQIPGLVVAADTTQQLGTYWAVGKGHGGGSQDGGMGEH